MGGIGLDKLKICSTTTWAQAHDTYYARSGGCLHLSAWHKAIQDKVQGKEGHLRKTWGLAEMAEKQNHSSTYMVYNHIQNRPGMYTIIKTMG